MSFCIFCKKTLHIDNVLKHEDNCTKQFTTLIGPDYETVNCEICDRIFYKDDVIKWDYNKKGILERRRVCGIAKHLNICKRINKDMKKEKTACEFCGKSFVNIQRHENKCPHQFKYVYGPYPKEVQCKKCGFYYPHVSYDKTFFVTLHKNKQVFAIQTYNSIRDHNPRKCTLQYLVPDKKIVYIPKNDFIFLPAWKEPPKPLVVVTELVETNASQHEP